MKNNNQNQNKQKNPVLGKVILDKNTRWSYVNVWEPKAIAEGAVAKYSVSLIIPKNSPDVARIKAAIKEVYDASFSKLKGNSKSAPALEILKTPLRDGDLERPDDAAYANSYFINANSKDQPGIVDAARNHIIDRSEVYSGVRGRASITFYAFNNAGNKGIACNLNNLQKWFDDTPLGSRATAESDFDIDEDDDFLE